jgi:hypothetical protein
MSQQASPSFYQIFQYIKLELFQPTTINECYTKQEQDNGGYDDHHDEPLTPFQKTYVSFPEFESCSCSTTSEEITATTAIPSFYNKPHFKPIWIH